MVDMGFVGARLRGLRRTATVGSAAPFGARRERARRERARRERTRRERSLTRFVIPEGGLAEASTPA
jgi:hypothetical protein